MIGGCLFAVLVGADPGWLAILMAVMVLARIIHMVLYYQIATERESRPRSYFFMLSWFAKCRHPHSRLCCPL